MLNSARKLPPGGTLRSPSPLTEGVHRGGHRLEAHVGVLPYDGGREDLPERVALPQLDLDPPATALEREHGRPVERHEEVVVGAVTERARLDVDGLGLSGRQPAIVQQRAPAHGQLDPPLRARHSGQAQVGVPSERDRHSDVPGRQQDRHDRQRVVAELGLHVQLVREGERRHQLLVRPEVQPRRHRRAAIARRAAVHLPVRRGGQDAVDREATGVQVDRRSPRHSVPPAPAHGVAGPRQAVGPGMQQRNRRRSRLAPGRPRAPRAARAAPLRAG